ncbi:G5 domain-containing protein [Actinomadura darangshiensis]|uniref:G5 domain-containing protein n=1 Tax=Actinomadura darangshiensis TaxID=705336 RepID=UPI001A9D7B7C|nr:G5 domain-containing protein [Actinomadura darangshiensis]
MAAETSPAVEKRTVTETRKIPYKTRKVNDATLAKGSTKVQRRGVAGVQTLTYEVTVTNGVESARKLVRKAVTERPVTRVVAVGTKQARRCDPNYGGACVPIASDVDCAGGSGNGPGYVDGPVRVTGSDIYDLDRDGDGIACDT